MYKLFIVRLDCPPLGQNRGGDCAGHNCLYVVEGALRGGGQPTGLIAVSELTPPTGISGNLLPCG